MAITLVHLLISARRVPASAKAFATAFGPVPPGSSRVSIPSGGLQIASHFRGERRIERGQLFRRPIRRLFRHRERFPAPGGRRFYAPDETASPLRASRVGQIRRDGPACLNRLRRRRWFQPGRLHHDARHFERSAQLIGGVENARLVFLHVAVVGHRQTLHGQEQRRIIAEHAAAFAANQLQRIGIFLLRHHAGAAGDAVAQFQPAVLLARIENPILGQTAEVEHRQVRARAENRARNRDRPKHPSNFS